MEGGEGFTAAKSGTRYMIADLGGTEFLMNVLALEFFRL